jgi:hypothetical protein
MTCSAAYVKHVRRLGRCHSRSLVAPLPMEPILPSAPPNMPCHCLTISLFVSCRYGCGLRLGSGIDAEAGDASRNVFVYDLGGGTFDVTIVAIESGAIEVLASTGERRLGGQDFTNRLVELIIKRIKDGSPGSRKVDLSGDVTARCVCLLALLVSVLERERIVCARRKRTTRTRACTVCVWPLGGSLAGGCPAAVPPSFASLFLNLFRFPRFAFA